MNPTAQQLYEVCDHTWPAAEYLPLDCWQLRRGVGGGKRVSAATAMATAEPSDIGVAAGMMHAMGQHPLFMITERHGYLDAWLAEQGYLKIDPVIMYALPIAKLTDVPIPPVTAFEIWEPLAIMREIWMQGGIGPARLNVMARAKTKTAILSRWNEKPAGVAFAALHDGVCMVHAVEVLPHQRRQGVAQWMMRKAAFWAQARGARYISVLCVEENEKANALYRGLGFAEAGRYHYRIAPE